MSATLWQSMGPWASRYLAAHQYWNSYGALSTHWDWAAASMDLTAPSPLSLSRLREKPPGNPPEDKTPRDITPAEVDRPPRRSRESLPTAPVASVTPPIFSSSPRDLSAFIVDDNSPPSKSAMSRLEPRCSDGRNLSVVKQSNFERGGHRLSPANQSPKGGLRAKSKQELRFLFGSGKQDYEQNPSLREQSKLDEQNTPLRGKSKSDLYVSYWKGKGESDFYKGKSDPPLRGKSKSDCDNDPKGKPDQKEEFMK